MDGDPHCQRCGVALTGQAVGELCANCLLKLALDPPGQKDEPTAGVPSTPPISGEFKRVRYFGDYELLEEIARGGMGVVYRARQVSLNRIVALKMILAGDFSSAATVERFQTEAESAARLEHPNIVPIYEIGAHEGQRYFSMRFLEGGTLTRAMASEKYSPRRAAELMLTVARAVHYAHQRGILHRDLKPGNILFDQTGQPHVADFGLAKLLEHDSTLTQSAAVMGTPSYMAPEQAAGHTKQLSTAADVYSLGAVLYELLTARAPFRGATPAETMRQVIEAEPKRPRFLNPAVDRDLDTISLKCLEKDPQRRYASADALANDLDRWLSQEPIQARPSTAWERMVKWTKRKPATAALTIVSSLALLLLIVGLSVSNALISRQREEIRKVNVRLSHEQAETQKALTRESTALVERTKALQDLQQTREREQRVAYFRSIALAEKEWEASNLRRADQILEECPVEFRNWEWHYLKRLCNETGALTFKGRLRTENVVRDVVQYDDDGKPVAYRAEHGTTTLLDAATGQEILRLPATPPFALSPDGRLLASAGSFRLGSNEETQVFNDSDTNAIGVIKIWDRTNLTPVARIVLLPLRKIYSVAFSPDAKYFAAALGISKLDGQGSPSFIGGEVTIREARTGAEKISLTFPSNRLAESVVFSPRGKFVATSIGVFEASSGKQVLSQSQDVWADFAFDHDEKVFAAASYRAVKVWDTSNWQDLRPFLGLEGGLVATAYSPDGKLIAGGSYNGSIKVWNTASGEEVATFRQPFGIGSLAFSADGTRIISGTARIDRAPEEVNVWELNVSQEAFFFRGHTMKGWDLAFNPDGSYIASTSDDKSVRVWNVKARREILTLEGHTGATYGVTFSPDGQYIASASGDRSVKIWELQTGREALTLTNARNSYGVFAVAFSPDGKLLASSGGDGVVKISNIADGSEVRSLQHLEASNKRPNSKMITAVLFSHDGQQILSAGYDGNVRIWDIKDGQQKWVIRANRVIHRLALSRDGKVLAAAAQQELKLWNFSNREEMPARMVHDSIRAVEFSPDGERLVSSSTRSTLKLWDTKTGSEILTLKGGYGGVAFSPDGKFIASASSDGTVKVWKGIGELEELYQAYTHTVDAAASPLEERNSALLKRAEVLTRLRRPEDARIDMLRATLPPRKPSASPKLIDLSPYYNVMLTESWHPGEGISDMSTLPQGIQMLVGVEFDVRGLVQVGSVSRTGDSYPKKVSDIAVGFPCQRLHFLHAAINAADTKDVTQIGSYAVHYANGQSHDIPIVAGRDVADWWNQPNEGNKDFLIAWSGTNESSRQQGRTVRLFISTWQNPLPAIEVKTIDFVSTHAQAAPFLVAITAE